MTEERLQVRVNIDFTIRWVLEVVEASGVQHVRVFEIKGNFVACKAQLRLWEHNSMPVKSDAVSCTRSIDAHVADKLALEV